ncbi:MAG: DAK2 domain-containing protein, partial [Chloroflexota bacterium]
MAGITQTPASGSSPEAPVTPIDGSLLRQLLRSATTWLERNAATVDALNVFPVPDGDTGTNMLLTMRAAVEAAEKAKATGAGQIMKAAAQGAVMGARGNSGVILSQILAGMARGLGEHATCDGTVLAAALAEGATTAYRAVTRPVEGTILTVARAAGDGATAAAAQMTAGGAPSCRHVLERALVAAQEAVERTPEQLPVLR